MKEEMESIKDTVFTIVTEKPYTRESYWRLYFEVLLEYDIVKTSKKGGYYLPYKNLEYMINPESVSRCYRKLKEQYPELAPSEEIELGRRGAEEEMQDINSWWTPMVSSTPKQTTLIPSFHVETIQQEKTHKTGGGGYISTGTREREEHEK